MIRLIVLTIFRNIESVQAIHKQEREKEKENNRLLFNLKIKLV